MNKKSRSIKWLLGIFFVLIILYSSWIGLDPVIEKFSETEEALPLRTYIWKDSFNLIKDFPVFGTGLGTFSLAYTLYKKDAYWPYVYDHAHNDYIELAAETGLAGFFLVLFALIAFYKSAIRKIRNFSPQKDPLRYYILLGCLSGMFGLFIHAVTEFNFQIPANAYYFIFLLGLSTSMLNVLVERKEGDSS
jgi:O-antigen ligase